MKKVSEYSDRIISNLKKDLENELILSIYDMLEDEGECDVDVELGITPTSSIKNIQCYCDNEEGKLDNVEVTIEFLDDDGLYYSDCKELNELNLDELYSLWEYIKEQA